jgi:hypothetical protein
MIHGSMEPEAPITLQGAYCFSISYLELKEIDIYTNQIVKYLPLITCMMDCVCQSSKELEHSFAYTSFL